MPWNGIGSVIGSLVGGFSQNEAIDKQNEANAVENQKNRDFNAQQATIAYNRQRAIIDANNEYESAKAQRERLEAAGLNPYLMMDGGSAGSATSASVTPATSSGSIPMQARRYEFMQNMAMQAAQIANINADTKEKEANAGATNNQSQLFWNQAEGQRILNEANEDYLKLSMKAGLNKIDAEASYYDSQRMFTHTQSYLNMRQFEIMTPALAGQAVSQAVLNSAKALNVDLNTKQGQVTLQWLGALYGAEYAFKQSQVHSNNAQAGLFSAQTATENILRIPRLWNMRFNNNLLKQDYDLGSENLKQSKWNTYFSDRTMREYTENYIANMRQQIGSWKGYDASWYDKFADGVIVTLKQFLVPALTGVGTGLGFGYGQTVGSRLATPSPRKVGFLR